MTVFVINIKGKAKNSFSREINRIEANTAKISHAKQSLEDTYNSLAKSEQISGLNFSSNFFKFKFENFVSFDSLETQTISNPFSVF